MSSIPRLPPRRWNGPTAMPLPESPDAPFFSGKWGDLPQDFLLEYEELADRCRLTDREAVECVVRYIAAPRFYLLMHLDGYRTGNWALFCRSLEDLYELRGRIYRLCHLPIDDHTYFVQYVQIRQYFPGVTTSLCIPEPEWRHANIAAELVQPSALSQFANVPRPLLLPPDLLPPDLLPPPVAAQPRAIAYPAGMLPSRAYQSYLAEALPPVAACQPRVIAYPAWSPPQPRILANPAAALSSGAASQHVVPPPVVAAPQSAVAPQLVLPPGAASPPVVASAATTPGAFQHNRRDPPVAPPPVIVAQPAAALPPVAACQPRVFANPAVASSNAASQPVVVAAPQSAVAPQLVLPPGAASPPVVASAATTPGAFQHTVVT
ncbi:hypothetical protein BC826DRAFT_1192721, partial [Russula brevipes]